MNNSSFEEKVEKQKQLILERMHNEEEEKSYHTCTQQTDKINIMNDIQQEDLEIESRIMAFLQNECGQHYQTPQEYHEEQQAKRLNKSTFQLTKPNSKKPTFLERRNLKKQQAQTQQGLY